MVIETTDPIIEIIVGPEIETTTEMVVGIIIDQIIEGMTVTRGMVIEIRTAVGLEKGIEEGVAQRESSKSRSSNRSQNRNENRRQSRNNTRDRDRSESRLRQSSHVRTNRDRCICY